VTRANENSTRACVVDTYMYIQKLCVGSLSFSLWCHSI